MGTAVTALSNGNSYGYDNNGNMTSRTVGGVTYTLTYDAENRLVSLSGGGVTAAYTYDGDGNRVKTVVNGVTVTYIGNYFEGSRSLHPVLKGRTVWRRSITMLGV
jgi:YD repeat-containing protein